MLHYVRSTTLAPMITGGQVNAVPPPGETVSADGAPAAAWIETRSPQEICAAYGSDFVPPAPLDKVAVALNTLDQPPLNARRVSPERGACGWYVWGGEGGGRSRAAGFFQTLQVAHLLERCPQIIPFLALAPGWRVRLTEQGPDITPPHAAPPPDNVAVRRIGSRTTPPPMVKQWVWLSILLHILAVVLFGDTTGGGARRGDRVGGPLNVTLQGPVDRGAGERLALRADSRLSSLDARKDVLPAAPLARPAKDAPRNGMVSPTSSTATENGPVAPVMPPVSATRSLTGHSQGAAGVHEAIYSLLMLQNYFICESANIEEIDPEVADANLVRTRIDNANLNTVMSNSFGFGGTNASLVFQRHQ